MGFYDTHVLPRLVHHVCGARSLDEMRRRVCAGLAGEVVEIGFGSGSNVDFYPPAVTGVHAVEPSDAAWRLAGKRVAASRVPIERVGLDGQSLPLPDAAFDAAISTWALCTIPDPVAALAEVRRVLKPGAALHFVEHGLAPDAPVQKWQHRLEPVQKRMAGGCHLTRPIAELITSAGFEVVELDEFYQRGAAKVAAAQSLGVAVRR
jgi:ubiquinone/menaquinone biosynthesis C-methylase UbiE